MKQITTIKGDLQFRKDCKYVKKNFYLKDRDIVELRPGYWSIKPIEPVQQPKSIKFKNLEGFKTDILFPRNKEQIKINYFNKLRLLQISNQCHYCKKDLILSPPKKQIADSATIDHVIPRTDIRRGLVKEEENIVLACHECNRLKSESERWQYTEQEQQDIIQNKISIINLLNTKINSMPYKTGYYTTKEKELIIKAVAEKTSSMAKVFTDLETIMNRRKSSISVYYYNVLNKVKKHTIPVISENNLSGTLAIIEFGINNLSKKDKMQLMHNLLKSL